jgi:hypothetical protein
VRDFPIGSIESRAVARMRAKHTAISGENYVMQSAEPSESLQVALNLDNSPIHISLITQS